MGWPIPNSRKPEAREKKKDWAKKKIINLPILDIIITQKKSRVGTRVCAAGRSVARATWAVRARTRNTDVPSDIIRRRARRPARRASETRACATRRRRRRRQVRTSRVERRGNDGGGICGRVTGHQPPPPPPPVPCGTRRRGRGKQTGARLRWVTTCARRGDRTDRHRRVAAPLRSPFIYARMLRVRYLTYQSWVAATFFKIHNVHYTHIVCVYNTKTF